MNDGKRFEQLVKNIERTFLPEGFQIETREKIIDEKGDVVAELDIIIKGKLGTANILWLIECRDRPSEGPAPASWIEQLVGRRSRFNFDKVMAASTTGFAEGVKEYAKTVNIELRIYEDIDPEEFRIWLPANAPLLLRTGNFIDLMINLEIDPSVLSSYAAFKFEEKIFYDSSKDEMCTIHSIFQQMLNVDGTWNDVPESGEIIKKKLIAPNDLLARYQCDRNGKKYKILNIEFDTELSQSMPNMPLVEAGEYKILSDGQKTIARVGEWRREGGIIQSITFIGRPKESDEEIT